MHQSHPLGFAGSYTDYLEYRRDDAQYKKEEAALAKRELVAANTRQAIIVRHQRK